MIARRLWFSALSAAAVSCATPDAGKSVDAAPDVIASLITREAPELAAPAADAAKPQPVIVKGTDAFTSSARAQSSGESDGELLAIDLDNASIADAADLVLGDILGVNYSLDDGVQGSITIKTSAPVSKRALLSLFESALESKGAVLIEESGVYRITPADKAVFGPPSMNVGAAAPLETAVGFSVQVVPLRFVAAAEMERILKPIASSGAIVRVDRARNLLTLSGSRREIDSLMEAVRLFDVDWLKGMSFALIPMKSADPKEIASDLSAIFANGENQPLEGVIRFIPNERLNAVLVISSRSQYLEDVRSWVERLDNPDASGGDQVFVYEVQNRSAESLAAVLQGFFGGAATEAGVVQPGLTPRTVNGDPAPRPSEAPAERSGFSTPNGAASGGGRIIADAENNALLIYASPFEYLRISAMLEKLDTLPSQVMIEATIAEVTLNDDLEHGLTWFFENAESRFSFSDVASGAVGSSFPGFSYVFSEADSRVALNALASVTDVKVVSSPTLMVLDNKTARLQVGDQVPVVTQSAVSTIDPDAPIVNAVSFRDTGVILDITPRVSDNGVVVLDITQEVSSVIETTTSGIDSPTIQQRRIETSVAVHDGESLALGGLIEDSRNVTSTGVPFLSEIPLLGEAFKSKSRKAGRTELLVLITPRVVRDRNEARLVTEEFRNRLDDVRELLEKTNARAEERRRN
ncbi:MAG TPA: type II secretion system protein GspD [Parvularcula sp.]|nr:type II secretion system protein GspD [Parvularcula sp.]HBS33050.1 type II secretion system protein GspD [Parvularcula sp.]HBS35713.1 type II secretion system protein GspD [Parvularcula sp.]